ADAAVRQSEYGEVIPSCQYAIVDEAHLLEDVATQYFGITISNYRVEDLARDVDRAVATGLIPDRTRASHIGHDTERVRHHPRTLFTALQMLQPETPAGAESRIRIGSTRLSKVADDGAAFVQALQALEADIALTRDVPEDVLSLARRAASLREDTSFLLKAD